MTFRTLLAMRVTQKVQFYTCVHLYISSPPNHTPTRYKYIYIYKYINAQPLPLLTKLYVLSCLYKLYGTLYLLNYRLYW